MVSRLKSIPSIFMRILLTYLLVKKPLAFLWIGLVIGLFICSTLASGGLTEIQRLHLAMFGVPTRGIVYETSAAADGEYYMSCSFLINKTDGSVESLLKKGEISAEDFQSLRAGDQVEIVYSSKKPTQIWMLKREVETAGGAVILASLGVVLVISGGGGIALFSKGSEKSGS